MRRLPAVVLLALVGAGVPVAGAHAATADHVTLLSRSTPETTGNGSLPGGISNDGRYVVYTSRQPNLVAGQTADDGLYAYLSDTVSGTSTRLTTGKAGELYGNVTISGNGQYVVAASVDNNDNPSTQTQLRLYSRATRTWQVIAMSDIDKRVSRDWYTAGISDDGSTVVYTTNLYTGTGNVFAHRAYRYDTATRTTTPLFGGAAISGSTNGLVYATVPAVSRTGRFVAMVRAVDPTQESSAYQLLRLDLVAGTTRVIATSGVTSSAANAFGDPSISDSGRYVGYHGTLALDGRDQAYVYDATSRTTTLVSHTPDGKPGAQYASTPQLSSDGRYAVYSAASSTIVPGTPDTITVYEHDRVTDTTQVLVQPKQPAYPGAVTYPASWAWVNGDGSAVAFGSTAGGLVPGVKAGLERVYLWRR